MRSRVPLSSLVIIGGVLAARGGPALAEELPTPFDFVSNLDLACYESTAEPPPAAGVELHHLNPAMKGMSQQAALGDLERVCLPVMKNGSEPPAETLDFIRWVDLACYKATAEPVDVSLDIRHLNPQLAGLPDETVRVVELRQLCLPVRKRRLLMNPPIPEHVQRLIEHVDVACYRLEEDTLDANLPLTLSHHNPIVKSLDLDDRATNLRSARQLCLPVSKNDQEVPPDVLHVVQWVDFLRYALDPVPPVSIALRLRHLNPLYAAQPWFDVTLSTPPNLQLMVPIAKSIPSGGGGIPPDTHHQVRKAQPGKTPRAR